MEVSSITRASNTCIFRYSFLELWQFCVEQTKFLEQKSHLNSLELRRFEKDPVRHIFRHVSCLFLSTAKILKCQEFLGSSPQASHVSFFPVLQPI
jgi:hypothetical protein